LTIAYIVISLFIVWIWVDYFRKIDVNKEQSFVYILSAFVLGIGSTFLIFPINDFIDLYVDFEMDGTFVNDFLYCTFRIGLLEEIIKFLPFLILLLVKPSIFVNPIDYIVIICVSALGFSATENYFYFSDYGPSIIDGRAILPSIGHMSFSALVGYAFVLNRFYYKRFRIEVVLLLLFFAAFSHGFYDFWLFFKKLGAYIWIITYLYYLVTISFFATILSNSLNNAPNFSYKNIVDSESILKRILLYYIIIFVFQTVLVSFDEGLRFALSHLFISMLLLMPIILIVSIRLTRFNQVKGRWLRLKFELPFKLRSTRNVTYGIPVAAIQVKGESNMELGLATFYQEYFTIYPVTPRTNFLIKGRKAYISEKLFDKDYNSYFLATIYTEEINGASQQVVLKPKTNGKTMVEDKYPIVYILLHKGVLNEHSIIEPSQLKSVELAYLHSIIKK
jgi:RsiW-degrading membrane proteinase PrsW (M82 family)